MKILIEREVFQAKQTLGSLSVFAENKLLFSCKTLELPFLENRRQVSCIPLGEYPLRGRTSLRFGKHLQVEGVKNRSLILIHAGNFHHQIKGCILVGAGFKDINKDGYLDVIHSQRTMQQLLAVVNGRDLMLKIKKAPVGGQRPQAINEK